MIDAKIEKKSTEKGYDIDINASGSTIELAKEITCLVVAIHDSMEWATCQRAYRHMIQLALAEDSEIWSKKPDDE
mgnify:CR=1 FL=1